MSHYTMTKPEVTCTSSFCCFFLQNIVSTLIFIDILWLFLIKKIITLALVGYETIIANSALRASFTFYHLISNARSWRLRPNSRSRRNSRTHEIADNWKLFEISPTRIVVRSPWQECMIGNLSGFMVVVFIWRFCALFRHARAICAARFQLLSSLAWLYVE